MSLLFWTGAITFGLAVITNPTQAIQFATTALGIRGMGFICTKITQSMNKTGSEIIDFTSWAGSAAALVGIVALAMSGVGQVGEFFQNIGEGWTQFWDTVTFWN